MKKKKFAHFYMMRGVEMIRLDLLNNCGYITHRFMHDMTFSY